MNQPHLSRINNMINTFLELHGDILANVFYFYVNSSRDYRKFMTNFLAMLKRNDIKFAFYWVLDYYEGYTKFILIIQKRDRTDMTDIIDAAARLCDQNDIVLDKTHGCFTIVKENRDQDKEAFFKELDEMEFEPKGGFIVPSHTRKYGLSLLKI